VRGVSRRGRTVPFPAGSYRHRGPDDGWRTFKVNVGYSQGATARMGYRFGTRLPRWAPVKNSIDRDYLAVDINDRQLRGSLASAWLFREEEEEGEKAGQGRIYVKVGETLTLIAPASSAGDMNWFLNISIMYDYFVPDFVPISRRTQRSKFRARVLPRILSTKGRITYEKVSFIRVEYKLHLIAQHLWN